MVTVECTVYPATMVTALLQLAGWWGWNGQCFRTLVMKVAPLGIQACYIRLLVYGIQDLKRPM